MNIQLNVVVNSEVNVGGINICSNAVGKYGSNIIWLVDTDVYVDGKFWFKYWW